MKGSLDRFRFDDAGCRSMIDQLPDATFVLSGLKFVFVNPAAIRLFGAEQADQLIGRSILDFDPVEGGEQLGARIQKLKLGTSHCSHQAVVRLDGTVIDVETVFTPFELGGAPVIQAVMRDITAHRALEAQLRQAQKMEAIGTLAGGIAHDFNNILGAIVAFTELAKLDAEDRPELLDNLNEVMKASQRAKELVSQILTFSRQKAQERRSLQLTSIVKETVRLLRATLPSSVRVVSHIDDAAPAVFADPGQIHQVLMNLCTNAAQAIGAKQGQIEISLGRAIEVPGAKGKIPTSGVYALLTVKDSGHGMDDETINRIFEPFFTTKGPGEGTGLGLAVVHGIMEEHDGAIRVRSEPGAGTTFDLYFPAGDPEAAAAVPAQLQHPTGKGESILIVDDEPALVKVTAKLLERLGYNAVAETDPLRAIERLRASPAAFQLLISDLTMPNITGVELAIEALKISPGLPILVCTGFSSSWQKEALQGLGIRDLLFKPLAPGSLAIAVRDALQKTV